MGAGGAATELLEGGQRTPACEGEKRNLRYEFD